MLLEATDISKSFGESLLFDQVNFKIEDNDKIGLVGLNGSGKSTLFELICGEDESDSGQIIRKKGLNIGQLKQHACENSTLSTYDEALSVFSHLLTLEKELDEINRLLETNSSLELIEKQQSIREEFEQKGGLVFRSLTSSALAGLGFDKTEQSLSVQSLSGGQKAKVELCKLLLSSPDLMLLDEPTNHLDIDAIDWLDKYIAGFKGAVVIISHDRYFLDKTANKIFEISNKKLVSYNGNYTKFCQLKKEREEMILKNYENTMEEVERIEKMIAQQKTFSMERNYRTIDSKQKQIDRLLEGLVKPEPKPPEIRLSFSTNRMSPNEMLWANDLSVSFENKKLYENVSVRLSRSEKVFLIGPNGCGKTTLLKQLLGENRVGLGSGVTVGYFDQHGSTLDKSKTVFETMRNEFPSFTDTEIRNSLASVLFVGDEVFKKISALSGGERAKLDLLRLSLLHDNLLFLDEPTNHLDLSSREKLEEALLNFDGTILAVSHDRYFINRLATSILRFSDKAVKTVNGNYDTYVALKEAEQGSQTVQKTEKAGYGKEIYLRKKEAESNLRKLKTRLKNCEERMALLEAELEETNKLLESEDVLSDYKKVTELSEKASELQNEIDAEFLNWEEISTLLENAE